MIGAPTFIARSITLQIFSAYASDSEPPKTVKSWREHEHEPAVDGPVAGDDAVAEDALLVEPEVRRAVRDERVELDERARVEQQVEALARGQLAHRVLPLDAGRSPTLPRLRAHPLESRDPFRVLRHVRAPPIDPRRPRTRADDSHHRPRGDRGRREARVDVAPVCCRP